jgi:threonine dehydrogenase-like Zn-dependent dehydrogenase
VGRSKAKLELARSWGLRTAAPVDFGPLDGGFHPGGALPAKAFPIVVEATGSPRGLDAALGLVAPRGTVVMKSTFREAARFDTATLVVDEITLLGSRCGDFARALRLLRSGAVKVAPMISRIFPLSEGAKAFEYMKQEHCLKVLLRP